jgi:hypothetical protein
MAKVYHGLKPAVCVGVVPSGFEGPWSILSSLSGSVAVLLLFGLRHGGRGMVIFVSVRLPSSLSSLSWLVNNAERVYLVLRHMAFKTHDRVSQSVMVGGGDVPVTAASHSSRAETDFSSSAR